MTTRLYFRSTSSTLNNLPTNEQSSLTPTLTSDAVTVNKTLDESIGSGQTSLVITSNATTSRQDLYFSRFVSPYLDMASLPAQTWTYNFATKQDDTNGNFPCSGSNKVVNATCYVYRPLTQTKVGDVLDGDTAAVYDEIAANVERAGHGTFDGASVSSMQNGDVLIFEVWFKITQTTAASRTFTWYYDGTTATATKNANVSNHASFLESPQTFTYGSEAADTGSSKTIVHGKPIQVV